jgi:hypothetical protein
VLGRGAAAAAHGARRGGDEAARVGGHVFRRAQIDVAPFDIARLAGIRLGRQTQARHLGDPLDRVQHRRRSDRAVDANQVGAAPLQFGREPFRRRAVERAAVLLRAHLRHDGQVAHAPDGVDCRPDLVQVAERLEHEQVDTALDEGPRLFAEELARFVDAGLAPGLDADAERPDGPGDVGAIAGRLACDPGAFFVDGRHLVGETERAELHPVGAERVGLDDVRAGAHVFPVHARHQIRLRDVQRVEALVDEDAAGVEHRAHRAVGDEHAIVERLQKVLHSVPR